jgi:hypothetical protein
MTFSRPATALALLAMAASPLAAHAGTPGSFTLFNKIPQFGIYVSTPPVGYTPPKNIIMNTNGTEFLVKLTPAQKAAIGSNVAANITYIAECDNYDRIGSIGLYVEPTGVVPAFTDPAIELVRWITPFSDHWQGQYATHAYPATDLSPFHGVLSDPTHDIWIVLQGGGNPYSGDPCTTTHKVPATDQQVAFEYTVSFSSTTAATPQSTAISAPIPVADYTSVPITGTAASNATGGATAFVIVSGHGSAAGGDEYKNTIDTLTVDGVASPSFSTAINCSTYAKYSPDGNPGIFRNNGTSNPRNWCPGALVPSHEIPVTIGASNTVSLDLNDPSVPSGSYYDTSVTLLPN